MDLDRWLRVLCPINRDPAIGVAVSSAPRLCLIEAQRSRLSQRLPLRDRGRSLDLHMVHVHLTDKVLVVAVQVRLAGVPWGCSVILTFEVAPRGIAGRRFGRGWD